MNRDFLLIVIILSSFSSCIEQLDKEKLQLQSLRAKLIGEWKVVEIEQIKITGKNEPYLKTELYSNELLKIDSKEVFIYNYPFQFTGTSNYVLTDNSIIYSQSDKLKNYDVSFINDTLLLTYIEKGKLFDYNNTHQKVETTIIRKYVKLKSSAPGLMLLNRDQFNLAILQQQWEVYKYGYLAGVDQFDQFSYFEVLDTGIYSFLKELPKELNLNNSNNYELDEDHLKVSSNEGISFFEIYRLTNSNLILVPSANCNCSDLIIIYRPKGKKGDPQINQSKE